jgi:DNA phosphorothioation-dependent restriction protein DptF
MGEAGAIVGGHIDRNELRQGLYITTDEDSLVNSFFVDDYADDGKLLIITGSAGDGKSALLSRAFLKAQNQGISSLTEDQIHMDATASTEKTKTYDKTLDQFFERVNTNLQAGNGPRSGVAINLGLAIDFFERREYKEKYPDLWEAIEKAKPQRKHETDSVKVLNLSHRTLFETHPERFGDGLLRNIVDKFDASDPESPFYDAFQTEKEQCPAGENCPLHYNVEKFTSSEVRENITSLLAAKSLIENSYLNPRRILDYLASILLPVSLEKMAETDSVCPIGKSVQSNGDVSADMLIWNSVFQLIDDHDGERTGNLDPSAQANRELDLQILEWVADPTTLDDLLGNHPDINSFKREPKVQTTLRKLYLEGKKREAVRTAIDWSWFSDFLGAYTFFNSNSIDDVEDQLRDSARTVNTTLKEALKRWSGRHAKGDYIEFIDGIKTPDYRFLAQWSNPVPDLEKSRQRTKRETLPGQLWFVLQPQESSNEVPVPISFELYILMKRISMGYNPNVRDLERSEGIRLIHSRLSEFTNKQNSVRIIDKNGSVLLNVDKDAFEGITINGEYQ